MIQNVHLHHASWAHSCCCCGWDCMLSMFSSCEMNISHSCCCCGWAGVLSPPPPSLPPPAVGLFLYSHPFQLNSQLDQSISSIHAQLDQSMDWINAQLDQSMEWINAQLDQSMDWINAQLDQSMDWINAHSQLDQLMDWINAQLDQSIWYMGSWMTNQSNQTCFFCLFFFVFFLVPKHRLQLCSTPNMFGAIPNVRTCSGVWLNATQTFGRTY